MTRPEAAVWTARAALLCVRLLTAAVLALPPAAALLYLIRRLAA